MKEQRYNAFDHYLEIEHSVERLTDRQVDPRRPHRHAFLSRQELQELRSGQCLQVLWNLMRKDSIISASLIFGGAAIGLASVPVFIGLLGVGISLVCVQYWQTFRQFRKTAVTPCGGSAGPQGKDRLGTEVLREEPALTPYCDESYTDRERD